jgi:hypothetical protein
MSDPQSATFNFKTSGEIIPIKRDCVSRVPLFKNHPSLLAAGEYEIKAQVPAFAVQGLVALVEGGDADLTEENCEYYRLLGEEFGLDEITENCYALKALRSAERNEATGQWKLGHCMEIGVGFIRKDVPRAVEYYRLSAEQGNSEGRCNYARCLENGQGVAKDLARAAEYYRLCGIYRNYGACRSIAIPSWVRVLDKGSFSDHRSLQEVTFESGSQLERIEESAFRDSGLRSIVIPSSVVVLGKECFYCSRSLESVTFENSSRLERIEDSAFWGTRIQSIVIPERVAFLSGSALCVQSLTSISISPDHQYLRMRGDFIEDKSGSTILRYVGTCVVIVIPPSVTVLGPHSFYWCKSVGFVTVEKGSRLERIERSAFAWSGLRSILIPSSVVVLGAGSFFLCQSLASVQFEDGSRLERIEGGAFHDTGLESIVIPSSVVFLGEDSFSSCTSLESVTFESGSRLEKIDESMFRRSRVSFQSVHEAWTRSRTQQPLTRS